MLEVKDVEELPNGGAKYNWVYKMAGVRLEGASETTEYAPNERIVVRSKGGIESTLAYDYQREGDGTRLTVSVDYKIPIPLVGKLAESFILKLNEREAETVLGNLKDRL
ncbi:MAG: hypothetical protein GTN65_07365, partial [Armatimonadetes bacterium]|nr:hypothetical protein [Armatimonadota bacterium]NIO96901.1 hypothetical protein [Armatimonadota bacterium]